MSFCRKNIEISNIMQLIAHSSFNHANIQLYKVKKKFFAIFIYIYLNMCRKFVLYAMFDYTLCNHLYLSPQRDCSCALIFSSWAFF